MLKVNINTPEQQYYPRFGALLLTLDRYHTLLLFCLILNI